LAGGSNIERVSQVLEKVGYKRVLELPKIRSTGTQLESCVQSEQHVERNSCLPEPIDLDGLRRYF
jgi:hypothetical protein